MLLEPQPGRSRIFRDRCRFSDRVLPASLPVAKRPNGAMLLGHLSQQHPNQVGRYLNQMPSTGGIGELAAQAYEFIDEQDTREGE